MAEPAFSPEMEKALDAYAVPPVPQDFTERLLARIEVGDGANAVPAIPLPARRRTVCPWRRTGRIVGSIAFLSLATATAAAAGIFGKPVYMPGISEALVEAKIVPAAPPVQKPKVLAVRKPTAPVETAKAAPPPTGSAAIVNRVTELRNDPDYAKLPAKERLVVATKEVRSLIRSGEASKDDVRAAVRELAQNADPATREAWRKAATERRERRIDWRERYRDASPEERVNMRREARETRQQRRSDFASEIDEQP